MECGDISRLRVEALQRELICLENELATATLLFSERQSTKEAEVQCDSFILTQGAETEFLRDFEVETEEEQEMAHDDLQLQCSMQENASVETTQIFKSSTTENERDEEYYVLKGRNIALSSRRKVGLTTPRPNIDGRDALSSSLQISSQQETTVPPLPCNRSQEYLSRTPPGRLADMHKSWFGLSGDLELDVSLLK